MEHRKLLPKIKYQIIVDDPADAAGIIESNRKIDVNIAAITLRSVSFLVLLLTFLVFVDAIIN